jgi:hypothetical protein
MHGVGVYVSGFNRTFIASTAWKVLRSGGDGRDSRQRDCVGIIGTDAGLKRAKCSNQSAMVRLPDQRSVDRLPTFLFLSPSSFY